MALPWQRGEQPQKYKKSDFEKAKREAEEAAKREAEEKAKREAETNLEKTPPRPRGRPRNSEKK